MCRHTSYGSHEALANSHSRMFEAVAMLILQLKEEEMMVAAAESKQIR